MEAISINVMELKTIKRSDYLVSKGSKNKIKKMIKRKIKTMMKVIYKKIKMT